MEISNESIRKDLKKLKKEIKNIEREGQQIESKSRKSSVLAGTGSNGVAIAMLVGAIGVGGYLTTIN